MARKIADSEEVLSALKSVMKVNGVVHSQTKLKELVESEMNKKESGRTFSAKRLRLLALKSDFVRVEIHYREGEKKKAISHCPVCDSKLKFVKNMTIFGGKVTIGHRCTNCPYWTGVKRRVPTRYIFTLK